MSKLKSAAKNENKIEKITRNFSTRGDTHPEVVDLKQALTDVLNESKRSNPNYENGQSEG